MNLSELYTKVNGDLNDLLGRFGTEVRVKKFLGLFLKDPSYSELIAAAGKEDWETAFRAAHTLKGVAANMSLEGLRASASELTEALRGGKILTDMKLVEKVTEDYTTATAAIKEFLESEQ